ncbi:carboxymuconolactone decarboxylase family protein [Megalodesulfovibrio gigas]|uniref:Putative 4-carboxymuconolactone decarboxylase n=1 Tax=Megalodesulfovibrio gigas (strain ATCC 19364 / DSM 1382 / NCIMB 9332 / VKM B-1759) TaxID=1121448 RepID=T2G8R0_MEGG1|nr:carboxymuconolactone decarboxylase family protein [Megalodesulfovibrio gigas]AGW12521.1 putative 4-carboxymuconolactone decarboxylase [Megalodesulfovibrio gigas DSM 1382 = ATCC 19364]
MSRYETGLRNLQAIDGRAGQEVLASLEAISPDLARYVVEYPFGDIYNRPGLGLRERELVTVAALGALGNAAPQLRVHLRAALHVGLTIEELKEVAIQLSVYAGFPAALNMMFAIGELEREHASPSGA